MTTAKNESIAKIREPAAQEIADPEIKVADSPSEKLTISEALSCAISLADDDYLSSLSVVESDDFLPPIGAWSKWGGLLLISSVGIAIALASFTPYNVIVRGNTTIAPDGEIEVVQAETSGTIVSINATENQTIKKGEIIAKLDNSALETEKKLLQNQIQQAQLQLQQIAAQTLALNHQIVAETNQGQNAVAEAEILLARSLHNYRNKQIITEAQIAEAQANLNLAEAELQQAEAELKSAQSNLVAETAALKSVQSKRNRYQTIAQSGALSQDRLEETKLSVEQQQQQVLLQQATVARYQSATARQEQAVAAAKARLDNMRATLNLSDWEIVIAKKQISQVQARKEATLAILSREQEFLKQQSIHVKKQLENYQNQLEQIIRESDRTMIKASASGTLFKLNLRNPGQNIQSGAEISQIAPIHSSLLAKTYIYTQDINQVNIGQTAQLKISACPYPDYGTVQGKVTQVSPDAIQLEDHSSSKAGLYEVTIKPESSILSQGDNQCYLQLGMEGRADIIAKEETVLKFLLRKARLIADL
ncbi:MAG: HlyD family efflux transporter periplasmic adaptor subunit [Xenococcus sp. (in: cyanobacteria)]